MSVRSFLGLSLAIALAFAAVRAGAEPPSAAIRTGGDWTRFGYDAARHNSGPPSTGITAANVARLRLARHLPSALAARPRSQRARYVLVQMAENGEDDWFSEPDVRPPPGRARQPVEDEWLEGDDRPAPPSPAFDLRALADRRVLVVASVFVAFLLALLAAAGIFNSGAPRTTAPIITTTAPPATPTTTTRPAASPPATALKPGDTGAQVKVLQRALASLGYAAGPVDGHYGSATRQAVTSFQHTHRLTADGIFGPKTLQALTSALGR